MTDPNHQIIDYLLEYHQIDVSPFDASFLDRTILNRMLEKNCKSKDEYQSFLAESNNEKTELKNSFSVCYTEFFRNSFTFSVLERIVLPALIHKLKKNSSQEIRIWSAACASGQESYSLAMLLRETSNNDHYNFRIFATDQNAEQIKIAQEGVYKLSDLKLLTINRLNKWFIQQNDNYKIKDELKNCIEYSSFDLLDNKYTCPPASIFGSFDIIMCSNLLFYYSPAIRKKIILKLKKSLSPNGYLITSETEREILLQYKFKEIIPPSAIFTTE